MKSQMLTKDFQQIIDPSKLHMYTTEKSKFATIFIVLSLKRYRSIYKEFAWVAWSSLSVKFEDTRKFLIRKNPVYTQVSFWIWVDLTPSFQQVSTF